MHACLLAQPRAQPPAQRAQLPCLWSQYTQVYCDTIPPSPLPFPGHDTKLYCDPVPFKPTSFTAIQFYVLQYNFSNPLPAIQYLYCNQPFQTCCNTISSLTRCIAIHLPPRPATSLLQYIALSCNTIFFFSQYKLGSSPKTVLHKLFFFHFFSFPATGKIIKKNILIIFFSFSIILK